jgi:hypothetical protein
MTMRGINSLYVQEGYVEERDGEYQGIVECDGGGFVLRKFQSGMFLSIGLGPGPQPNSLLLSGRKTGCKHE